MEETYFDYLPEELNYIILDSIPIIIRSRFGTTIDPTDLYNLILGVKSLNINKTWRRMFKTSQDARMFFGFLIEENRYANVEDIYYIMNNWKGMNELLDEDNKESILLTALHYRDHNFIEYMLRFFNDVNPNDSFIEYSVESLNFDEDKINLIMNWQTVHNDVRVSILTGLLSGQSINGEMFKNLTQRYNVTFNLFQIKGIISILYNVTYGEKVLKDMLNRYSNVYPTQKDYEELIIFIFDIIRKNDMLDEDALIFLGILYRSKGKRL